MIKWLKHPVVSQIHNIIRERNVTGRVLSIGSSPQDKDVLNLPYFQECRDKVSLIGINISGTFGNYGYFKVIEANAHSIPFDDNYFDLVICNAMLEHDSEFWLTLGEVNRVLNKRGLFIVNVPAYVSRDTDLGESTFTYKVHGDDYYRFSERSLSEVILKDMDDINIVKLIPQYCIIGWGQKK